MFSDSVLEPSDRLHGKGHLLPKPNLYIDLRTLSVTRAYHIDCKVPSSLFENIYKTLHDWYAQYLERGCDPGED